MWKVCCTKAPKDEIIYCCQLVVAISIVAVGLLNITFTDNDTCLWSILVSGAVGYLLPNPKISKEDEPLLPDAAIELIDEVSSR